VSAILAEFRLGDNQEHAERLTGEGCQGENRHLSGAFVVYLGGTCRAPAVRCRGRVGRRGHASSYDDPSSGITILRP
jgi:hypothetical protein